jgi:hypothetical protein
MKSITFLVSRPLLLLASSLSFAPLAGCGSSSSPTQPQAANDAGRTSDGGATIGDEPAESTSSVVITGQEHGKPAVTATIQGNDYLQGDGVQCEYGKSDFRIDATGKGPISGYPNLLLQYFNFDPSQLERDEPFPPPAPLVATFRLAAAAYDGTTLFNFMDPDSWKNTADSPACHTSFTRFDTIASGTLTCRNVLGLNATTPSDITVKFSCAVKPF